MTTTDPTNADITIELTKTDSTTSLWRPLETGTLSVDDERAARLTLTDSSGAVYLDRRLRPGQAAKFTVRGTAGRHNALVFDAEGQLLGGLQFILQPATRVDCNRGPYAKLARQLEHMLSQFNEGTQNFIIDGKRYRLLVCWSRDHVYTLKAQKYHVDDVQSGMDFYMERQRPDGTFWDCIHKNPQAPAPNWFAEALGEGFFTYLNGMDYTLRRIPVEADVEFVMTEGVWYAWKASGDDAWMAQQLPRLDKALKYNSSNPHCWSKKNQLVKRSFCMDSWDFANPYYCKGDHRVVNPGDPQFLFHGDNSGLYSIYTRLAEMHEALGHDERAAELREQGEAFRQRANEKLFFENHYGHMIPDALDEKEVYDLVGDERERMSLSTGYTINRGLPTHEMAVKILKEYQRRGRAKKNESFAEWWSMDPPYSKQQWPSAGPPVGEYMNGAVCPIVAGELAKAAFDHGMEDYGVDILQRLWDLAQRDGGHLHQVYRRIPTLERTEPKANFTPIDLRPMANVGLRNGATEGVTAWTGEGDNDMRNLPTERQKFGPIVFDVVEPKRNAGRSIVRLCADGLSGPAEVTVPVPSLLAQSVYFLHATGHSVPRGGVAGYYDVDYADGTTERIHVCSGREIQLWWGTGEGGGRGFSGVDSSTTRRAWWGANGQWKNVGVYMFGWNNPHPEVPITAIRAQAVHAPAPQNGQSRGGFMLAGISLSDERVKYEESIRSYGLPDCWSQAAVYHAIVEGLAGIEDKGRAFSHAFVAPRWSATEADRADVCLHYPASDGYCAYRYRLDAKRRRITLDLTGSFDLADVHCLLPGRAKAKRVVVDGEEIAFETVHLEGSVYADFQLDAVPAGAITIEY